MVANVLLLCDTRLFVINFLLSGELMVKKYRDALWRIRIFGRNVVNVNYLFFRNVIEKS